MTQRVAETLDLLRKQLQTEGELEELAQTIEITDLQRKETQAGGTATDQAKGKGQADKWGGELGDKQCLRGKNAIQGSTCIKKMKNRSRGEGSL